MCFITLDLPTENEDDEQKNPVSNENPVSCDYIVNKNTKKFHDPNCSSVADIKEKNKLEYSGSREELINQGYAPCKRCNP